LTRNRLPTGHKWREHPNHCAGRLAAVLREVGLVDSRSVLTRVAVVMAGTALAIALVAGSAGARCIGSPGGNPGNTNQCQKLDGQLTALKPGTQSFDWTAITALQAGCVAYVATSSTPSSLDLEFLRGPNIGTAIVIGSVTTPAGPVTLTDIALTSSGTLYGIDFGSDFYRINPGTGAATEIGAVGSAVNGLVVGPNGVIYASGAGELVRINPMTGTGTVVGTNAFTSSGDLAFTPSGTLFLTATGSPNDVLVNVNPHTGAGTEIGSTGEPQVYGLVSSNGTLFGQTSSGSLLKINPGTGASTVLATGGPLANGMTTLPSQPDYSSHDHETNGGGVYGKNGNHRW
jgi:hypothetical protein